MWAAPAAAAAVAGGLKAAAVAGPQTSAAVAAAAWVKGAPRCHAAAWAPAPAAVAAGWSAADCLSYAAGPARAWSPCLLPGAPALLPAAHAACQQAHVAPPCRCLAALSPAASAAAAPQGRARGPQAAPRCCWCRHLKCCTCCSCRYRMELLQARLLLWWLLNAVTAVCRAAAGCCALRVVLSFEVRHNFHPLAAPRHAAWVWWRGRKKADRRARRERENRVIFRVFSVYIQRLNSCVQAIAWLANSIGRVSDSKSGGWRFESFAGQLIVAGCFTGS